MTVRLLLMFGVTSSVVLGVLAIVFVAPTPALTIRGALNPTVIGRDPPTKVRLTSLFAVIKSGVASSATQFLSSRTWIRARKVALTNWKTKSRSVSGLPVEPAGVIGSVRRSAPGCKTAASGGRMFPVVNPAAVVSPFENWKSNTECSAAPGTSSE